MVFFNSLFFASSLVCYLSRVDEQIPAALTVPVVFPFLTKCKSLPCVILIIDHVIVNHVLLSATPTSLSQANAYSARYTIPFFSRMLDS